MSQRLENAVLSLLIISLLTAALYYSFGWEFVFRVWAIVVLLLLLRILWDTFT